MIVRKIFKTWTMRFNGVSAVRKAAAENAYIPLLYVRVFELLGEDTAPLLQARENGMRARAEHYAENRQRYPYIQVA